MKLISVKPLNAPEEGVFRVEFSENPSLLLSTDYLSENLNFELWEEGREISASEEEALRYAAACHKAEKIALRLIARAEQSSLALSSKLEKRGMDSYIVRAVISRLLDRKLLDDERYAELWIRSRLNRKAASPLELLSSLGKRGIDRGASLNAVKKVLDEETEYSLLLKYLKKARSPKQGKVSSTRSLLKFQGFSHETLTRFFDS